MQKTVKTKRFFFEYENFYRIVFREDIFKNFSIFDVIVVFMFCAVVTHTPCVVGARETSQTSADPKGPPLDLFEGLQSERFYRQARHCVHGSHGGHLATTDLSSRERSRQVLREQQPPPSRHLHRGFQIAPGSRNVLQADPDGMHTLPCLLLIMQTDNGLCCRWRKLRENNSPRTRTTLRMFFLFCLQQKRYIRPLVCLIDP